MTFDEFVARYRAIPDYPRARHTASHAEKGRVTADTIAMVDREIAEMDAARPRVASWEDVPDNRRMFVRWGGGNRGVYWRRGPWLYIDPRMRDIDRACDPISVWSERLDDHRMSARVWLDDTDGAP